MLLSEVLSRDNLHEDYAKQIPKFCFFFFFQKCTFLLKKKNVHLNETVMLKTAQISFGAGCVPQEDVF